MYAFHVISVFTLFFSFRYLIARHYPEMRLGKYISSGILAIALSLLLAKALFLVFFYASLYEYHPDRRFTQNSWEENIDDRHQMLDNLISSEILLSKSKNQIKEILGSPKSRVDIVMDTSELKYFAGSREWGLGLKFYYLDIKFQDGRSIEIDVEEVID